MITQLPIDTLEPIKINKMAKSTKRDFLNVIKIDDELGLGFDSGNY